MDEVITECRKRGATPVDVLAFEFKMGLFPAVLEEARGKGIDLTPKYIPAEVFDKRGVDKGQVVFHDISIVEATPRYDKKDKRTIQIELTDFWVYYTQSFRTRRDRNLELTTALHSYDRPGRYTVAVKVIDIFGNDTMTLVPVNVG